MGHFEICILKLLKKNNVPETNGLIGNLYVLDFLNLTPGLSKVKDICQVAIDLLQLSIRYLFVLLHENVAAIWSS